MVKAGKGRERKAESVVGILHELYPDADCALNYSNAHELLFATIMSAQTTDKTVNGVTETLFKKYRTVEDFANADLETFQDEIRSTGFYRNKAKHVIGAANMIVDEFGGEVPGTMEELTKLPGVARKTANVVLGTYFHKPSGFVVDTHVKRVSFRIGLTAEKRPAKVEKDLMECFPKDEWIFAGHALIDHGRAICDAKKPLCDECAVRPHCERNGV
jgi:endonuclease-3